ncbi:Retrovirus-related Pol polyprotein from transposon [Oopsacas minuta]|uniref:Retrovirus-related Pol polyprotein from transposon n=1 Tax=Oopsacas minuta TaxID=111878 RepID=A0AAV7JHR8_9METZ|nr:Retrovirus-related Pol polyprotein from transposon [Oopsacas minuta]
MIAKQLRPVKALLVISPVGNPWQRISVDVLGVSINAHGNKYILVVQDYFTKWLEAFPMPDQRANTIVGILRTLICLISILKELHSDQGRNFENALVLELFSSFGVKSSHKSISSPRGWFGGEMEPYNVGYVASIYGQGRSMGEYLRLMLYAYNTSVQSSIRTTPYSSIYCSEPGLSIEEDKEYSFDTQTYEVRLKQRHSKYLSLVADQLAYASRYQKRWYDKHATRNIYFKVGEMFG